MTMATASAAVQTARDYYDSDDADRFYRAIWGGEDIHIGLYDSSEDGIFEASRRTVVKIASLLGTLDETTRVLDIGSGYGGAARFLAHTYKCQITALNLSAVENARARELNAAQGLSDHIEVVGGSFETIPYPEASFDVVWSQDAILHSGFREKVLAEVVRVLKPGGHFVFTDPMQADDCPPGVLQPILERIHLESLGSPAFYQQTAASLGLIQQAYIEYTPQLVMHYTRVLQETERQVDTLLAQVSLGYIERMKKGLRRWIEGGEAGHLAWGIFHFRKE